MSEYNFGYALKTNLSSFSHMVEVTNVTKIFANAITALKEINFQMKQGEFVSLVGPTGAGKTTFLRLIYMDEFPTEGEVKVADYSSSNIQEWEVPELRRKLGVIFQDLKLLNDRNVYENVSIALEVMGEKRKKIREKVFQRLSEVGLQWRWNTSPPQLSRGEQQKVAIARALVHDPFLLLADEPTGSVDPQGAEEILGLLKEINVRGTAVLMATNNPQLVKKISSRVVYIEAGEIKG